MAEYIDENLLIEKMSRLRGCSCSYSDGIIDEIEDIMSDISTADVIPIPEGATNGEVIKAIFPNAIDKKVKPTNKVHFMDDFKGDLYGIGVISLDWWNAPYKAESEE